MTENINHKAVSGVIWSALDRFSSQAVQFIFSIIIARKLLPSDYGLIAMLGIFLAIAQVFVDSGFSNALIQKKNRTDTDYSTVFYSNIVISVGIYFILYFLSPFIADFYQIRELEIITKIVSLNIIISAFGIVQRAQFAIALNFRIQAIISLISVCISGIVGIILAYQGYGVWTLVVQSVSSNLLNILLLWVFSKWRPTLVFSKTSFKALFGFGVKLLLSAILHTLYTNLYTLVIGKKFSSTDAGLYNRATSISQMPSVNITSVITRAIFPIQCSIQDDDKKLSSSFLQYIRMSCYIIFPLMTILFVLARPLVIILLTEKWLPMVPLLRIMCIVYMWYPIMVINNQILNVKGRSDYFLKSEIIVKIVSFAILFITIQGGLIWICLGLIMWVFSDIYIRTRYSRKVIKIGLVQQIKAIFPIFILSISFGGVIFLAYFISDLPIVQIIIGIMGGSIYFLTVSKIIKIKEFLFINKIIKTYWPILKK